MTDEKLNDAVNHDFAAEAPQEQDTIEDLWKSFIQDKYLAVRQPAIDANDFELEPALITMVQQNQYTGHSTEDPNEHLVQYLRIANTVKLNGVRQEVIKLQLFPFSLRDIAEIWFDSLPYGSVNTWEELMKAYFSRFLPPFLISKQRMEIPTFKLGGEEGMYTAGDELARCDMRPSSEFSERSSRARGSGMIQLNKLSAIEAKLDALIHWVNKRKSS